MTTQPASPKTPAFQRIPLLVLGAIALISAILGGLVRLGWGLTLPTPTMITGHGTLMVSGFLGTLIGVERAVALGQRWSYLAPLFSGAGALLFLLGAPILLSVGLIVLGSLLFTWISLAIVKRQSSDSTLTMTVGAACWFLGNVMWLCERPIHLLVPLWIGFLLLTIAGERLQLSLFTPRPRWAPKAFIAACVLFLGGALITDLLPDLGYRLSGAGLLALSLWLFLFDIARRTLNQSGLRRYVALCLLSGYFWLAVSGALLAGYGVSQAGPIYDAALHAFFLGFVFAMIFGHAPIIFPSVLNVELPFSRVLYLPLGLLQLSLLTRTVGDLADQAPLRLWGGALNGVAIVLFILCMVVTAVLARRKPASTAV